MKTSSSFLPELEALARSAGDLLMDYFGQLGASSVQSKSASRDLVSEADLASEKFILSSLKERFPQDGFLAEETCSQQGHPEQLPKQGKHIWVVDPLDGTVNFVHGLPMWAVSIARLTDGEPDLAVVHLPRLQETFSAELGKGAHLDGNPIAVSAAQELSEAVLATGFPYRRHLLQDNNLENFQRLFLRQRGVRRMGAAAVDLAYVAAGRLDAFWELHLSPWDVAAGVLLVKEAGGAIDTISPGGDYLFGRNIVAGPKPLVDSLSAVLLEGRDPHYPPLGDK